MRRCFSSIVINYQSVLSAQMLSISIAIFCIIYLLLSSFPSITVQNMISNTWFDSIKINRTDILSFKLEQKYRRPRYRQTNNNFICARQRKHDGTRELNVSSSIDDHQVNILRPFCDVLPTPRTKWLPARRYSESDIVFMIYTSSPFYQTRALAVRDSWLSRVTHKYFFSEIAYPTLPVTVIEGATSNMQRISNGLQLAYRKHNGTAKFYFLVACNTFVNVFHLLKCLEPFDYKQPMLMGGSSSKDVCYVKKSATNIIIPHPFGDAGLVLSAQLVKQIAPRLKSHFENDWPTTEVTTHADAALTCLAHSTGVTATIINGFFKFNPEQVRQENLKNKLYTDSEPSTFHDVHPLLMPVLDEFFVHQLIDRLGKGRDFDELMKFTRHFVVMHYELLRVKQRECTLPTIDSLAK